MNLLDQLSDKFLVGDDCWEWTACKVGSKREYGCIRRGGKNVLAHRAMYELFVAPIPEGLTIDHLCRNPGCVRPSHLEPVTRTENTMRGFNPMAKNARKTHCVWGHEFTPENTRTYKTKSGVGRACRACSRRDALAWYYRNKDSR